MQQQVKWEIQTIINTAIALKRTGHSAASTGEQIAAAFVLNRQDLLPGNYDDMVEAWDRLEPQWQKYVRFIKREYMHLID